MLRILTSKKGAPTAFSNGIYLNSRYDPREEARKAVSAQLGSIRPQTVLVLGETLGYLSEAILARSPNTRCIQLFYDASLYETSHCRTSDAWHPQMELSHFAFLMSRVNELEAAQLSIVEWTPSAKAYPETAREILISLKRILAIFNGNIATTTGFGKVWLRNTVQNFLAVNSIARQLPRSELVVVAASGPSLHESIEALQTSRPHFYLIALPSALSALAAAEVLPDLVVITDPGYYSGVHLTPFSERRFTIAMPYTAVKSASRFASEVILLNQDTYLESVFIERSRLPHIRIRQNGTVAGTALDLARIIGRTIVFAGLDLTNRDIQSHARPHAFDPLIELPSNRLIPSQTTRYLRSLGNLLNPEATSRFSQFETYAGWFDSVVPGLNTSVFRLNESPVHIDGMAPLENEGFARMCRKRPRVQLTENAGFTPAPPLDEKKTIVRTALSEAQDALLQADIGNPSKFCNNSALSIVYFASTPLLLKALNSSDTDAFAEAITATSVFIDKLAKYVDTWTG